VSGWSHPTDQRAAGLVRIVRTYHRVMPRARPFLLALTGAALVLAGAACSADPVGSPSSPSVPSTGAPDPQAPVRDGGASSAPAEPAEVLRFTAPRLGGGTVDGHDLAGRDVAFWFWAPW
jgi:hypothetical protein